MSTNFSKLTHLSLFSGIGGIDLAAEWAGFETVGQCEWADYPTKVLEKHWPAVPRWRDIHELTAESFSNRTGVRTVDLISGGDPCQPHSLVGKRKGEKDDRYLWPEMFRVISEIQPTWVINENVIGSISNGILDQKIFDLESQNYETQSFDIPAFSVAAHHERRRILLIAHSKNGNEGLCIGEEKEISEFRKLYEDVCYPSIERLPNWSIGKMEEPEAITKSERPNGRKTKSGICRVANGIPNRVDRLKCLGNAVVPQQVYPILKAIAEIERS